MMTDEIEAAVRQSVFMGDASQNPEYSQAKVLDIVNAKLNTVFVDAVLHSRSGYWLQEFIYTVAANDSTYRVPPRACIQGLEKVEWSNSTLGPWYMVYEIPIRDAQNYRSVSGTSSSTPLVYTYFGDLVDVIPTPTAGSFLKLTYYVKPSRIVAQQSSTSGGGTVRGQITSIAGVGSRQIVVNVIPFDQLLSSPATITSGQQTIDIVHPDGWHELTLVGATQTFSGTTITIGGTDDLGRVQVGDFVRVAGQTDWPALPDEFHQCLVDAAAIKILLALGLAQKADDLALNNGADIVRFKSALVPRTRSQPKSIPILRRSRGSGAWPWGWRIG